MTPEQFAYWLQGFTELTPDMERPSAAQWQAIKDHLQTVFVKVTPPVVRVGGPVTIGQPTTQEARPGKTLEDALRRLSQGQPDTTGWPSYPGLTPRIMC